MYVQDDVMPTEVNNNVTVNGKGRCSECPRNADRKVRTICDKCKRFICAGHSSSMRYCKQCKDL